MNSSVLTVILNWRTPEMTLRSVSSSVEAMQGIPGEIIVVDNDSGDGSEAFLRDAIAARGWEQVRVIQAGRNGGFGAGNNVGIRAGFVDGTRPDYIYILNSDAFPAPDAIAILRAHLDDHPATGFASGYVHGPDGVGHQTLFRFPSVASEFEGAAKVGPISRLLARHVVPLPIPNAAVTPVDWTAGCSLLVRDSVFQQIGLFDEGYFLYYEETDLCLRARRAGWGIDYIRASEVEHLGSVSTGMGRWARTPRYWYDSRWRYFSKNHGRVTAWAALAAHLAGGMIWRVRAKIQGRPVGEPPHFLRDMLLHAISSE